MKRRALQPQVLWRWLRRRTTADERLRHAALWLRVWLRARVTPRLAGRRLSRGEIGHFGEIVAARWLATHGRKVLYCNFRGVNDGEVDIVARHRDVLTFVEVKTRTGDGYGGLEQAVPPTKVRRIRRLAAIWLAEQDERWAAVRIDVVGVRIGRQRTPEITHLRGVG